MVALTELVALRCIEARRFAARGDAAKPLALSRFRRSASRERRAARQKLHIARHRRPANLLAWRVRICPRCADRAPRRPASPWPTGTGLARRASVARRRPPRSDRALVSSIRAEPAALTATRAGLHETMTLLTQAKLVRINRATQEVEPWLATAWTRSPDGLHYTLALRPRRHLLRRPAVHVRRRPLLVPRPRTTPGTTARWPTRMRRRQAARSERAGRAHRRRRLPVALCARRPPPGQPADPAAPRARGRPRAGTFASAWGIGTPPAQIVGLGPFVPVEYQPASGWSSRATRTTGAPTRAARGCRSSIAWCSRSCRTRTPSCCSSSRGRST